MVVRKFEVNVCNSLSVHCLNYIAILHIALSPDDHIAVALLPCPISAWCLCFIHMYHNGSHVLQSTQYNIL